MDLLDTPDSANVTDWGSVALERVQWLMIDRLPFGELTIVEGPGGLGKTTMLLDLAARVSTGRAMPDGTPGDAPADVLLIAEEDRASILKARLVAAGADLNRIHHIVGFGEDNERFTLPTHSEDLLRTAEARRARLIVIDALFSHFDQDMNPNHAQDVRRVLGPLSEIAHRTGAVVTATRHWGKTTRGAVDRGLGSVDILNVARSVLTVGRHPHDEAGPRVVAVAKSNLGTDPARVRSLTFSLEPHVVSERGIDVSVASVVWGDDIAVTADDLATSSLPTAEEKTELGRCVERIREMLADGPRPAADVQRELRSEKFSRACIFRAKTKAAVTSESSSTFPRTTHWSLSSLARAITKNNEISDTTDTLWSQESQSSRVLRAIGGADTTAEPCVFFVGNLAIDAACKRCGSDHAAHS